MVRVLFCPHLGYERYIFGVKVQNYLHISEKSSTFAGAKKSFDEPTKFSGDYTQVPRGRVAWAVDHFVVLVGQWAKDIEEELTALLEKYFALPYFEFRYDEHWDLGHGWSGDL